MKIAVSACLLGENCKYSGGNNYNEKLNKLLEGYDIVPVCPEVFGGLPTPRVPSEIVNGKVIMKDGTDVDKAFRKGAKTALKKVLDNNVSLCILQPGSPSCGTREIYDGSFSGKKIPGKGVFAKMLADAGITAFDADETEQICSCMIQNKLFELSDSEYADFQAKLTPGIERSNVIGVRAPALRKLAKEMKNSSVVPDFLTSLPHRYYDENMLHGCFISEIKDYETAVREVDNFLPYVDNWAVCDTMKPKAFSKRKPELLEKIREWAASKDVYTCRFGLEMLMNHFLDTEFTAEYLEIPASVHNSDYYVKMMQAWFFATALAKQWDSTVPYITEKRLDTWVHNKTIQKARESFRISDEQKEYLKKRRITK